MGIQNKLIQIILIFFIAGFYGKASFAKTEVNDLVCEYLVNPAGIDVEKPRLSWKIFSDERNILQTAYEIKVAETEQAFKLLMRKEYPSWLYPVTKGATTIWERWDGICPDGSFQDPAMNSFNHYSYGSIGEWLFGYIAGVNPDETNPGFRHIVLSPHPGGGLTWAKAEFESMYGRMVSSWRLEAEIMIYSVEVKSNTSATIVRPMTEPGLAKMNGKNVDLKANNQIKVGSGSYQIEFRY